MKCIMYNKTIIKEMKNQAGPAQDPWPPQPSRSGPGPLAPQAKPVRPRTLGPPSQAGPAQDPWPPKPSRPGPGPLALQAGPAQDPWNLVHIAFVVRLPTGNVHLLMG